MTMGQLLQAVTGSLEEFQSENDAMLEQVNAREQELRGILRVIAEATNEGE
jgi:hypothetical protein